MNKHIRYLIIFSIIIATILSLKLYNDNLTAEKIKRVSVKYEAEAIADFMIAFRTVYQGIFINNHKKLDESNIDFLPVKTTNEIAEVFSSLNIKSKIATVSDRPRNAVNMVNERQRKVMEFFRENKNEKSFFETIDDKYYYSQPLYITPVCLKCHGQREEAPKIIRDNYDKAYGYKLGELRGIIDIELSQTKLSAILDENKKDRRVFLYVFLAILFIVVFMYAKYNINLEKRIQKEEQEIRERELKQKRYLDTVIESNHNAIIAINQDKTILTYNAKAEEIFGFTKEEMIGTKNLLSIIPLNYRNIHTISSEQYFKTGKSKGILDASHELEGLKKDGTVFPIRISFGSNNTNDEQVVIANITDITEEKELLKSAQDTEKELKKSIELFGENVIASNTDLKGRITYASKAFCDISGYSQKELLGSPHNIVRHPDMPKEIFKDLWKTIKSGEPWKGEVKNLKKGGGYYWVRTSIMPSKNSDGDIVGYTSIRHDISPQKAKEEFMANMSHELRTPLNAIIGFSGILMSKLADIQQKDLAKQINSSSNSLLNLINDILDLSKIQDSNFTIEPFKFNAYNEIIEFTHQFDGLAAEKTLILEHNINKNLQALFYGDWLRIGQIALNLISNAIKFTPKNGTIMFSADYRDNNLILCVCDNGIGMDKETQNKIFKPFIQADGSTTRKYGGTGLGLSITQNLVEIMEGTIELESHENKGSTFTVTLPLEKLQELEKNTQEKQSLSNDEESKENSLEGHILIVEDNKTNQMLIQILIEEFGLTCDMANDGEEAIELYNPDKHALILMDENMPNMNGLEAMKILRARYKEKCGAIIALTANAMQGDREKFLNLGMDEYLSKPIDEEALYNILKEFL